MVGPAGDRGGDMSEVHALLDLVVSDYGVLAKSPGWWLQVPVDDLRPMGVMMACEDVLGTGDDPQHIAEFLARTVADRYGY